MARGLLLRLGALSLLLSACGDRERPAATVLPPRPSPALRLVVLTDLAGALEPCGCQSRPLGGLDKAASKLAALRADNVPLLLVAAGDLWFGAMPDGATAGADASTQEIWKAETLNQILGQLGLAAATPGPKDLSFGAEELAKLAAAAPFRVLPGVPAGGQQPSAAQSVASWITTAGRTRVGLIGVSSLFLGAEIDPANQKALFAATQSQADALRKQGAQLVVLLLSSDQRVGRRLAGALSGVDFVVQGGLSNPSVPAPSATNKTVILRAAQDGRGLLVVDLYPRAGSSFVDISDWTRREQGNALRSRITELKSQIEGWQRDPNVDKAGLAQQQQKLAELEADSKQLERPRDVQSAAFDARFEELAPEVAPDPAVGAVMDDYDARINAHNRAVFADLRAPAAPAGTAHYAGSDACRSCHAPAFTWWAKTTHGRAYSTLEQRHKQFNLSCVGCHVTGYNKPGGAAVVHNEGLINVGCESCHGPASEHVAQPDTEPPPFLTKAPGADVCKECHTPEHSDRFEFSTYVARMRAPGHGLPAP